MGAVVVGDDQSTSADCHDTHLVPAGSLLVSTSGSTGTPKGVLLSAEQLQASWRLTEAFFRARGQEPGAWLVTLPLHHIAGAQVALRSLAAGAEPMIAPYLHRDERFTTRAFVESAQTFLSQHGHGYTSLVPAQVERLIRGPHAQEAIEALRAFAGILLGGAPAAPGTLATLRDQGVSIVTTYGSSETAGGVVYDGVALEGVTVEIRDPDATGVGRIALSGPTIGAGYHNSTLLPAATAAAFPRPGTYLTNDLGRIDDGVVTVVGRDDDVINSAGLKISLGHTASLLQEHLPNATGVVTLGIPDTELGEALVAFIEIPDSSDAGWVDATPTIREQLKRRGVTTAALPRQAFIGAALPLIGPGKPDRGQLRRYAELHWKR